MLFALARSLASPLCPLMVKKSSLEGGADAGGEAADNPDGGCNY